MTSGTLCGCGLFLEPRCGSRVPKRDPVDPRRIAPVMYCREFREKHVGFVDDTLPAIDMEEMHHHLRGCARCARHDTAVRRGLMLVRSLPQIEPSAEFMARLNERLAEARLHRERDRMPVRTGRLMTGAFAAMAAGLALAGYIAIDVARRASGPAEIEMPPVVASAVEPEPSAFTNPAYVAAISTGMPVWPAVLMADQAPQHLANVELYQASAR